VAPDAGGRRRLLEVLLGIATPDAGSIVIDGTPTTLACPDDAAALGIGYPGAVPEDIEPGDILADLVRRARLDAVRNAAGASWTWPDRGPGRSGTASPRVLVLDEPFAGLDEPDRLALERAFRSIAGAGAAVLIGGASAPVLDEVCDRVLRVEPRTADA
jgi:ABC-type sugar transport system ATPase subunit